MRAGNQGCPLPANKRAKLVAQIFNLPYRGFAIGGGWESNQPSTHRSVCRLQIGDTAECNSALLWLGICRAGFIRVFPAPGSGPGGRTL